MSRIRQTALICALATAVALPVPGGASAAEDAGWQVDLKQGRSSLEGRFGTRRPNSFDDDSDTTAVEVGYRFNKYIGVQAGYHDLGSFRTTGVPCPDNADSCIELLAAGLCIEGQPCLLVEVPLEAEVTGWSLAAVPSWPFTERFSAFGKIGVLGWDADISASPPVFGFGKFDSFSGSDLVSAVGLRYRFGERLGALVEHQRLDLDLGTTTAGVSWRF